MIREFYAVLESSEMTISEWCRVYDVNLTFMLDELYRCKLSGSIVQKIMDFLGRMK